MGDHYSYTIVDYFYTPFLVIIIFLIGFFIQRRKIDENPVYKYYFPGLFVKVIASIIFLIIYTEYYGYGDTIDYLRGSDSLSSLLLKHPTLYIKSFMGSTTWGDRWFYFIDYSISPPPYFMWKDPNTRAVMHLTSIINLMGCKSFLATTVLMAAFSYIGVWKLFLFFTNYYPHLVKRMSIAVLFLPSLVFWGSGVMKDTYTFAALAWLVFNIYMILIKRKKLLINILLAIINAFIIIKIKPYIFVAIIPGIIVWFLFNPISKIKNKLLAISLFPIIASLAFLVVLLIFSSFSGQLGEYRDVDKAVQKAKVIQEDLTRSEAYGSNYYNIGRIEGTYSSLLKVAPMAIIAGMYRPYLWESKNPVMLISGLENFFFLFITLFLLIRLKFFRFFQFLFSDPILIFSIFFTILFMFAVGLASANFGALVRYKIPALPFFVGSMFIMLDKYYNYKKQRDIEKQNIS